MVKSQAKSTLSKVATLKAASSTLTKSDSLSQANSISHMALNSMPSSAASNSLMFAPKHVMLTWEEARTIYDNVSGADPIRIPLKGSSFVEFLDINEQELSKIFVDKTKLIYHLANQQGIFLIARPRRFGKSLTVDILNRLFSMGPTALPQSWIAQNAQKWTWPKYHVIRLSLNTIQALSTEAEDGQLSKFESSLRRQFIEELPVAGALARSKPLELDSYINIYPQLHTAHFFNKILEQEQDHSLVLLIDEYDAPLNSCFQPGGEAERERRQRILRSFYGAIKNNDAKFRFVFITGVTNYALDIFSDFNCCQDLTFRSAYSNLVGFTKDELVHYFAPFLEAIRRCYQLPDIDALFKQIDYWYDGYRFSHVDSTRVYNPIALLNLFHYPTDGFQSYWTNTGSNGPTFLQQVFQDQAIDFNPYASMMLPGSTITADIDQLLINLKENLLKSTLAILYQAGYLTIKRGLNEDQVLLGVPNNDVLIGLQCLIYEIFQSRYGEINQQQAALNLQYALIQDKPELFQECFAAYFNTLSTSQDMRLFNIDAYLGNLLAYFVLSDIYAIADFEVTSGRVNIVAHSSDKQRAFVFALKLVKTPEEVAPAHASARAQILSHSYGELRDFNEIVGYTVVLVNPHIEIASFIEPYSYTVKPLDSLEAMAAISKLAEQEKQAELTKLAKLVELYELGEIDEIDEEAELDEGSELAEQHGLYAEDQLLAPKSKTEPAPRRYLVEVECLPEPLYTRASL